MDTCHLNRKILVLLIITFLSTASIVKAVDDTVYPATVSISAVYTLNDTVMTIDDTLIIRRTVTNNETSALTCFYFCENLPNDFSLISHSVTINNIAVNYDHPSPTSSSAFTNYSEYYWVLDYPGTTGTYNLFIQPNDVIVIEYKIVCSTVGTYTLPLHTFIAHNGTTGIFGFTDSLTVRFYDVSLGIDDRTTLPNSFSLGQNYPNPFNPSTTIEFSVPEKSYVTIKIYNLLGESVATLLQQNISAGNHVVTWNGMTDNDKTAPSGVYFYKLFTQNMEISKKMLLLK